MPSTYMTEIDDIAVMQHDGLVVAVDAYGNVSLIGEVGDPLVLTVEQAQLLAKTIGRAVSVARGQQEDRGIPFPLPE